MVHAMLHPQLHRRAAVGAYLHQRREHKGRTHNGVAARRGEVRLRVHKAHNARGLAADAGLGDVVAAGDVALERGCNAHTCTSRQDRRSRLRQHCH